MSRKFEYDEVIHKTPDNGGAYVIFPWNIREVFRKGRVKVHAAFDGIPYDGSIVNMGGKGLPRQYMLCDRSLEIHSGKAREKRWGLSPYCDRGTFAMTGAL